MTGEWSGRLAEVCRRGGSVAAASASAEETEALGRALGEVLRDLCPLLLTLDGEMGVGKTAFTRGVCEAFGAFRVKSPTYTVVNEYRGAPCPIFHFDFYRLEDEEDLASVDYDGYIGRGLVICEWSEKLPGAIPRDAIRVRIMRTDAEDGRRIELSAPPCER